MAFEDIFPDGNLPDGPAEKKTYLDDSAKFVTVPKGGSVEVRFLSRPVVQHKVIWATGFERTSRLGRRYKPSNIIPVVGHLPGFDGRCILSKVYKKGGEWEQNNRPKSSYYFPVFSFAHCHEIVTVKDKSVSISYKPCTARGPMPNAGVCELCRDPTTRRIRGKGYLRLSIAQAQITANHDMHIQQFPLSEDPREFFGQKVIPISAQCKKCGSEIYDERKLSLMNPEDVVKEVTRKTHKCPNCGYKERLKEVLHALNAENEAVVVVRGSMYDKSVVIKKEIVSDRTRLSYSSDLLPFEPLKAAFKRLRLDEKLAKEAQEREFNFEAIGMPFSIDRNSFEDTEKYVKAVTNAQLRSLNWLWFGNSAEGRKRHKKNPFFQEKKSYGFDGAPFAEKRKPQQKLPALPEEPQPAARPLDDSYSEPGFTDEIPF